MRLVKKYLLVVTVLFFCTSSFGKVQDNTVKRTEFRSEINKISTAVNSLKSTNNELQNTVALQKEKIDKLIVQLEASQSNVKQISDTLNNTVSNISSENKAAQSQIQDINQTIASRTLFWIIIISTFVLLGLAAFFILRHKFTSSNRNFDLEIEKTKQQLEKLQVEANKHDSALAGILHAQLNAENTEKTPVQNSSLEINHKLPLKVGDEIHRMRKRIENMPQDVKGLGALRNSIKRLEEEFNESGYEIEELLGKKYVDGMKIEARFVDNPDIPKGEEIITDVLRPQVEYKGEVIQVAKVEVGKSY